MKINNQIMKITMAVLMVLSAGLAFFRFDMLNGNKAVDASGLYTDKSTGNLFGTLVFILIAVTVVFAFLIRKNLFEHKKCTVMHCVSAVICMLLMLTTGISGIFELMLENKNKSVLTAQGAVGGGVDVLLFIEMIFSFASVAYFLYEALKGSRKDEASGILALIPVVWLAVRAIRLFMNIETQINTSSRSFTLLFIVVTMMFFMYEAEFTVPKGKKELTDEADSLRTAKYTGFGLVTCELAIIFALAPIAAGTPDVSTLVYCITDLALALFAAVRIFLISIKD